MAGCVEGRVARDVQSQELGKEGDSEWVFFFCLFFKEMDCGEEHVFSLSAHMALAKPAPVSCPCYIRTHKLSWGIA